MISGDLLRIITLTDELVTGPTQRIALRGRVEPVEVLTVTERAGVPVTSAVGISRSRAG
jgi:hypothetical protein